MQNNHKLEYDRAVERMRPKNFVEKFQGLNNGLSIVFGLFAVLSALTGFSAFFEMVRYTMPLVLAILSSAVFFAVLEVAEAFTTEAMFHNYYSRKSASPTRESSFEPIRTVAAVFFILLSIVASAAGTWYGVKMFDTSVPALQTTYAAKSDSIARSYDRSLAALDSTKAAYFAANTWRGKLKNNAATDQYNAFETEAAELRKAKNAALAGARNEEAKDLLNGRVAVDWRAAIAAVWVVFLSAAKVAKHWFKEYYAYRLTLEGPTIPKPQTPPAYVPPVQVEEETVYRVAAPAGFAFGAPKTTPAPAQQHPTGCLHCGGTLKGKKEGAKFCGDKCKNKHNNRKR